MLALLARFGTLLALMASLAEIGVAADMSSTKTLVKPGDHGAAWSESEIAALRRRLDEILSDAPALRGAHVGLLATDARTRKVLYERDADGEFIPASNAKLVTGSVALAKLGPAFRFRTVAYVRQVSAETILRLYGGGDALLNGRDLDSLVDSVRAFGITSVTKVWAADGHFDSVPYPAGWVGDDFAYDYGAVVSAASFEENTVHLTVGPGHATGDPVTVSIAPAGTVVAPYGTCDASLGLPLESSALTVARGRESTLDLRRSAAGCIEVVGEIPLGAKPEVLDAAVPSPPEFLRQAVEQKLNAAGIPVATPTPLTSNLLRSVSAETALGERIWVHESEPLDQLLADFWYPSDNLIGELLLKELGIARTGQPGSTSAGLDLETAFLRSAGVDVASVQLFDGSGLSRYDRMTPRSLVALLLYDWRMPWRDTILDALPVAGVRGSLAHSYLGTPVARRVFAKTGGMLYVTNLSGYIAPLHHGAIAFSFLIGDALGDDSPIAALRARVLSALITAGGKT